MRVAIAAGEGDQLADGDLSVGRLELRSSFPTLSEKSSTGSSVAELPDQLLARDFNFVDLVVEDGEARPALGIPVLDLLREARLSST